MGEGVDPNPRIVSERLVDPSALVMGNTAENVHDRYPAITKERTDAYAVRSQDLAAKAYADGKIQPALVPVATRSAELGFGLATTDEPMRPGTTVDDLAGLEPRSVRTAGSPRATPRASTTAPPPPCWPPRTPPTNWACPSR